MAAANTPNQLPDMAEQHAQAEEDHEAVPQNHGHEEDHNEGGASLPQPPAARHAALLEDVIRRASSSRRSQGSSTSDRHPALEALKLEEASDGPFLSATFDPVNLLEVGVREWRDRTLSLQCLNRSRSVAAAIANSSSLLMLPNSSSASEDQRQDQRSKKENDSSSAVQVPPSDIADHLLQDYANSLSLAPHHSLIRLVILYHQALCQHGFADEAARIASLLEGLREAKDADIEDDLQGMDLLLKDGLLQLYLRIQPYLPPVPGQIVKFKSVTYTRKVFVADSQYDTVLTKALECIKYPLKRKKGPENVTILKDVSGYLMPGTMTLVLGPLGCGKSSLLQVLSGQLETGSVCEGTVTYNDERVTDIRIHRLAAMVDKLDLHLPHLTVRETLEFALDCTMAFRPKHYGPELMEIMGEALKIGQDPKLEVNLSMMGLKHVANRYVGSPLMPSITEDERHRLTAAEMFSGAHAVYFFDQPDTIAEDSMTFDLLTSVRIFTRVRQTTVMASFLQPSSRIFDLFDRLIILNQGNVVYQGPCRDALPYFESLGYSKPKHLGIGEFLQEVTTSDGVMFLKPGFHKMELEDFVASYKLSDMYKDIRRIVDSPNLLQELWVQGSHPLGVDFIERKNHDGVDGLQSSYIVSELSEKDGSLVNVSMDHTTNAQIGDRAVAIGGSAGTLHYVGFRHSISDDYNLPNALTNVAEPVRLQLERPFKQVENTFMKQFPADYVHDWKTEFILLIKRELKATWRNKLGLAIRLFQVLFLSYFVSFLLFRVKNNADQLNMNLYRTGFFVSLMNMTNFNLVQLPALMDERAIYYKQRGAHFFRPVSYLLAKVFGSLPFSFCEATIWTVNVYFIAGMSIADGGWHFFVYYLIILLTVLHGASMIRFVSFLAPDKERAGILIGLTVALFILFAGFLIPRFQVPKYWIWMYYLDPLQWAITALVINEYNSANYSQLCKDVLDITKIPQCAGRPNDTVGHAYLARGQFYISHHWIAVSVGVLCGWILVWNVLTYFALSNIKHDKLLRATRPLEAKNKINAQESQAEDVEMARRNLSHTAVPITLSWHELSYDIMVPSIGKPRTIINYVSGWGEPNDMVALFGSTGSGKTTLLNCLAGRKVLSERIGGEILVNSYPKNQKDFGHIMGYVDKIDAYIPYMTIRETVVYSAATRLGKLSSRKKQQEFVEEVLELTELKSIENTLVISLINDVTFHQEKLLAIATELVANPSVLFLDDPTKGLDSVSAARVTRCLQQIASTGRLVIATLKYPSQRILSAFTKAQILKTGGETVYFGPVGKDGELIRAYFEAIPGTPLCPLNKCISAFVVEVIGADDVGTYRRESARDYAFEYRVSELALRNHVHLQHLRRSRGQIGPEIRTQGYGANFAVRLCQNILAYQHQYWRNVNYTWGRMVSFVVMSVLLGSVYFKVNYHTTFGMNSLAGSIFISLVLVGLTSAQNIIPQVVQVRAISQRERAVHQSSALLYNISWTLAELPYLMVANLIFCSIFLPMTNMAVHTAAEFFGYWFISLEFYIVITFLGILCAVVSPLPQVASVLVPILIGMWVSTSGLVIPKRKILNQFIWIFWTNPLQYAMNSLTSLAFYCDINKPECLNGGLNPKCAQDTSACVLCDCPRLRDANNVFVWSRISSNRSLSHERIPYDILALILYAVLVRFLTYLAVRLLKHNRRT